MLRADWRRDAAWRKAEVRRCWREGASECRLAWQTGMHRRTIGRYLAGYRERPSVRAAHEAGRPLHAEWERWAARRGARCRKPGRWTAEHERRRAAAVLLLLALPWCRVADAGAAVCRSRRTVDRWLTRCRWPETLAEALAERCPELLRLAAVSDGQTAEAVTLGGLLTEAAERHETLRGAIARRRRGDFARLDMARSASDYLPHLPAARHLLGLVERERETAPAAARAATAALLLAA